MSKTLFPCSICNKEVKEGSDAVFCDFCKQWVHHRCSQLTRSDFKSLVNSQDAEVWSCLRCNCEILPFNQNDHVDEQEKIFNQPTKFKEFFSDMNSASDNDDTDPNQHPDGQCGFLKCRYYDVPEFKSLTSSKNFFSFLHLNISSITKHLDDLESLLSSVNHHFKIIAISESRLTTSQTHNPLLEGYHSYSTPTEAQAGGTILYISDTLNSSTRTDLNGLVYKSKLLESTFAEITLPKNSNIIVGSIYKHPSMDISEFENTHIKPLLEKTSREGKTLILLGDFNINLLKADTEEKISNFLDTLGNNLILPQIILPTRLTTNSKTLIDNIYLSPTKFDKISGNLTVGISDHLTYQKILLWIFCQLTGKIY